MDRTVWNDDSIKRFWKSNNSEFAGDVAAPAIVKLAGKYLKGKVLDVGAGSGALIKRIPNSVGIDIVPRGKNIIEGSITEIPFPDEYFDTVITCDVLEHLPDDILNKGLIECKRVLKTNGHLVIVIPFKENLMLSKVMCPKCGCEFHRWGHVQYFDNTHIREITSGMQLVDSQLKPLGFLSQHKFLRYFYPVFIKMGWLEPIDLILVVKK